MKKGKGGGQFMNLLKKHRKEKGLTLIEVSLLSDIPQNLLSQFENGQRSIPADRAQQLAKIYKVPIEKLFEPVRFIPKNLNM
jgi:transcriptional regulator with XRE-family HTH domain